MKSIPRYFKLIVEKRGTRLFLKASLVVINVRQILALAYRVVKQDTHIHTPNREMTGHQLGASYYRSEDRRVRAGMQALRRGASAPGPKRPACALNHRRFRRNTGLKGGCISAR